MKFDSLFVVCVFVLAACGDSQGGAATIDAAISADAATSIDGGLRDGAAVSDASVDAALTDAAATDAATADATATDAATPTSTCVFGDRFENVFFQPTLHWTKTSTPPGASDMTDAQKLQVVAAVTAAGTPGVTTPDAAVAAVDGETFEFYSYTDSANARQFEVVVFQLGGKVSGSVFEAGTTTSVSRIDEGLFVECTVEQGPIGASCAPTCAGDTRCASGDDVCVLTSSIPSEGVPCVEGACPSGALLCAGASGSFGGLCRSSWMRKRFINDVGPFNVNERDAIELPVTVSGVSTVCTDIWVALDFAATTPETVLSDLNISARNPSGTVGTWDGTGARHEGNLLVVRLTGIPGDESARGAWTVTISTFVSLEASLDRVELRLGTQPD